MSRSLARQRASRQPVVLKAPGDAPTLSRRTGRTEGSLERSIAARLDEGWRRWAGPEWLERWTPRPFALAGGVTQVAEMGAGKPLLLLPPLPGYKEAWIALAPRLAGRYRVIAFDLRSTFEGRPGWDALVADVATIARELAGEPAIVAGHSFGGALAMRFALEHPEAVRGLVLSSAFRRVTTSAAGFYPRFVEQPLVLALLRLMPERAAVGLARALARRRRWVFDAACDLETCGLVVRGIRTVPASLVRQRLALAFAHSFADAAKIRVPTLVVWGEHDTPLARAEGAALSREIRGAVRAVSPGRGHLHPLSGASWLAETILHWAYGFSADDP